MQIKLQLNKLELRKPLAEMLQQQQNNDISFLSITAEHILNLSNFPLHHKDPFDRLLISQATVENAILLSKDEKFDLYSVQTVW